MYNPHIGRFLQTDPIGYGDGINWYRYCGNNPGNCVDLLGLEANISATHQVISDQTFTFDTEDVFDYWFLSMRFAMPIDFFKQHVLHVTEQNPWSGSQTIHYEETLFYGVRLFRLNGINLLDEYSLDAILKAGDERLNSFHEINQWTHEGIGVDREKLYGIWTPFRDDKEQYLWYDGLHEIHDCVTGDVFYYDYGDIYGGSSINYIATGHALNHLGYSKRIAYWAAHVHNITTHLHFAGKDLYWALKGWDQYGFRAEW